MLKWQASILSKIGSIMLIGSISWMGWQHLGPKKPEIGPIRRELADKVVPGIVEDIRTSQGTISQVALLHFENDPTDYVTNILRTTIEQRGILDLLDRTMGEKISNLLNLRHTSYGTKERAIERSRNLGCQSVLFGTIHSFESYPDGARLDVEVNLLDVSSGTIIFSKQYSEKSTYDLLSSVSTKQKMRNIPWFQRLFVWIIIVLLLPVFSINFIREMLRKKSNKVNASVLIIYTAVDALLAFLMVGAALNSLWPIIVFLTAITAAFAYNIRIMTFALRLEDEI